MTNVHEEEGGPSLNQLIEGVAVERAEQDGVEAGKLKRKSVLPHIALTKRCPPLKGCNVKTCVGSDPL